MLDIAFIRNNPDVIKDGIRKKRMDMDIDELLAVDEEMRKIKADVERLRAERNRLTKEVPKLQGEAKEQAVARVRSIRDELSGLEPQLREVEGRFETLMLRVPNPPDDDVPGLGGACVGQGQLEMTFPFDRGL